jgi:hypothetical protein
LLEDPVLRKALDSIRATLAQQMWESALNKVSESDRQRLDALAWASEQFEKCLFVMIESGEHLSRKLLEKEKIEQRHNWADIRKIRHG